MHRFQQIRSLGHARDWRGCYVVEPLEMRTLLAAGLSIIYGNNGISTLTYNGSTLIDASTNSGDGFSVNRYYTKNSSGTYASTFGGAGFTSSWNDASKRLTYTYPAFGSIAVQYVQVNADRLNMIFTVTNRPGSGVTLGGVDVYPASIHFPYTIGTSAPGQWFPLVNTGIDGPEIVQANYTSGTNGASMALVNDGDVTRPLYTSLFTIGAPNGRDYYMWVGTGPKDNPPTGTPVFYHDTAPGETDTFETSLRFGPAGADPFTLAPDVISGYAAAYPYQINWPDRRAIASLHPSGSAASGRPATNPNGWFNNNFNGHAENVTTSAGLDQLSADLLTYAANSITEMRNDHSQGMIVWDLEGEKWPQATTYIGDPRLTTDPHFAPELAYNYHGNGPIVDQFFAAFRNADFRVGLTIRPTQILYDAQGTPGQYDHFADGTPVDEVTELSQKIAFAIQQWGCTIFYLDSNSGFDRDALRSVQQAFPNVLIIPEHSTTATYASGASYGPWLNHGVTGTTANARQVYPDAFSVIYPADGDRTQYLAATQVSVSKGDIILFRGWFHDSYNDTMLQMYNYPGSALPPTPGTPQANAANAVVNLSWPAVTGDGIYGTGVYNVKRSLSHNGPYTTIGSGVFGTSYIDTNVSNGTRYYYVVSAVNGKGEGPNSSEVTITPSPFALVGGTLYVTGTAASDTIAISQSGSIISLTVGATTQTFDASMINAVVISGLALDDTVNVNSAITKPVTFNGGEGNDTLNINAGTFTFPADAIVGSANLTVNIATGASAIFNSTQHLAGLSIQGNAIVSANGTRVLVTKALSIGTGQLDLADNDLIVDYAGTSQLQATQSLISKARNSGNWLGAGGITSTSARNNPQLNTTLGAMEAADYKQLTSNSNVVFDGEAIDDSSVLVKYTYYGDANFDGTVNTADFTALAAHFNGWASSWDQGDFNVDGMVNALDFNALATNFGSNAIGSSFTTNQIASARPTERATANPAAARSLFSDGVLRMNSPVGDADAVDVIDRQTTSNESLLGSFGKGAVGNV